MRLGLLPIGQRKAHVEHARYLRDIEEGAGIDRNATPANVQEGLAIQEEEASYGAAQSI